MFLLLLFGLLLVTGIHLAIRRPPLRQAGETVMRYLLAGYCGVPMVLVSLFSLARPELTASHLGLPGGNPFQSFVGVALLGMGLIATMAIWIRGSFIAAPALCWAVFFAGATMIHLGEYRQRGALNHGSALLIFATHGLIALLLLAALGMSGAWRAPTRT